MVYSSGETEVERISKYAERELNFLYDELERIKRRSYLIVFIAAWVGFIIGFVVGIEFVLYKVF